MIVEFPYALNAMLFWNKELLIPGKPRRLEESYKMLAIDASSTYNISSILFGTVHNSCNSI